MQATLQLDPFETGIVRQLVTALVTAQKPGRALCDLARRHNAPDAEVFERYAATLLHESGVEHLANTPLVDSLSLEGPGYGNLAHLSAKSGLSFMACFSMSKMRSEESWRLPMPSKTQRSMRRKLTQLPCV